MFWGGVSPWICSSQISRLTAQWVSWILLCSWIPQLWDCRCEPCGCWGFELVSPVAVWQALFQQNHLPDFLTLTRSLWELASLHRVSYLGAFISFAEGNNVNLPSSCWEVSLYSDCPHIMHMYSPSTWESYLGFLILEYRQILSKFGKIKNWKEKWDKVAKPVNVKPEVKETDAVSLWENGFRLGMK